MHLPSPQKICAWAELVGFVGSIRLHIGDLKKIVAEEASLGTRVEELRYEDVRVEKEMEKTID